MTQVITTARVSSGWARGTTAPEGSCVVRGLVDRARGGPALAGAVAALGPRWSGGAWGGGAEVAGPAEAGGAFACLPCGPVFLLPCVTVTGSLAGPTAQLLWPRCPPSPFRRHPFYLKERLAAKPWPLGRERSPDGLATGEAVTRETPDSVRRQACRPGSQGEVGLGSICCQHVTVCHARRPRTRSPWRFCPRGRVGTKSRCHRRPRGRTLAAWGSVAAGDLGGSRPPLWGAWLPSWDQPGGPWAPAEAARAPPFQLRLCEVRFPATST